MSTCNHVLGLWAATDEAGLIEASDKDMNVYAEELFKFCPRCGIKLPRKLPKPKPDRACKVCGKPVNHEGVLAVCDNCYH